MLDLEERLSRHYADVAAAPSLHPASSLSPRFVLAGLVLALIAGAAYVSGLGNSTEDIIAGPIPEEDVENGSIDPELVRLLERTPFDPEGTFVTFIDLEVARRGPTELVQTENGDEVEALPALDWAPSLPIDVLIAASYPSAHEEAFGYSFGDVERTLGFTLANGVYGSIAVLDTDSSDALDRAMTPSWAEQNVRTQEGSFDVLDWGDGISIAERSDIRPLGETGQLAAFDENMIVRTMNRERLQTMLATDSGAPTLAGQDQLLTGIARLNLDETVGFTAQIVPSAVIAFQGEVPFSVPTLRIVAASLDGSSRAVLGFLPGTDIAAVELSLRNIVGSSLELSSEINLGPRFVDTAITRDGELIVIDFAASDAIARPASTSELSDVLFNLFIENPEILP